MGHKVHPVGFRLGVVKDWQSRWYAERDYKDLLAEDLMIRDRIHKELANAAVSKVEIERAAANQVSVTIHTAKPGIVIGKNGEKVDNLRAALEAKTRKRVRLNILEIRTPELDAYLVARAIAEQLEKRVAFRRAMKQAVQKAIKSNAKGIKVLIGGRLGGAEIARSEKEVEGKIPLHTLRANIDYGQAEAHTTFGLIGIKVWIYKGDVLPSKRREAAEAQQAETLIQPAYASREGADRERRPERRREGAISRGPTINRGPTAGGGRRGERGERPGRPRGEQGAITRPPTERPQRQPGERTVRAERPQGERAGRARAEQPQAQEGAVTQAPTGTTDTGAERAPRTPRTPRAQQGEQVEQATGTVSGGAHPGDDKAQVTEGTGSTRVSGRSSRTQGQGERSTRAGRGRTRPPVEAPSAEATPEETPAQGGTINQPPTEGTTDQAPANE